MCYDLRYTCNMTESDATNERISSAALGLFLAQGIRKTSLEEVAESTGVSRMTVYRYYPDKSALVREAFVGMAAHFQRAREELDQLEHADVDAALDHIFRHFAAAPGGPVLARLDELRRLYPDTYEDYRRVRSDALNGIFTRLRDLIIRSGRVRTGVNEDVVRVVFLEALLDVMENPALKELALPPEAVYATIRTVLLHGLLGEAKGE